jgi:hypothetical protein
VEVEKLMKGKGRKRWGCRDWREPDRGSGADEGVRPTSRVIIGGMSLLSICQWIQNTDSSTALRESTYLFPIIETTHVLALSLSVGLLVVSDLRLIGVSMRQRPASEVFRQLAPWMLAGFAIMFASGLLLFWSQALKAYNSMFFRIKLGLLVLAALNAAVYHYRRMDETQARLAGWLSLMIWAGVIAAGRTMAYTF